VAILEIKIQNEIIDLYDDEKVVQSFSLINIEDITKRESEYSNTFKIPKTNKNLQILGYSDFLNSDTLIPYQRLNCEILIDGFLFKRGFVSIEIIENDISLQFFTGNAGFYEIIKNKSINQIDLVNNPSLKSIWSLSNVIALRNATSGIYFPMIDYNGMPTATTTVDVRLLLPSFFRKTLIEAICEDAGYTLINNIETSIDAYNNDILPTSKNDLKNDQETIDANTYKGAERNRQVMRGFEIVGTPATYGEFISVTYRNNAGNSGSTTNQFNFNTLIQGNPDRYSTNANGNHYYIAGVDGIHNVNLDLNINYNHKIFWKNGPNESVNDIPRFDVKNVINWIVRINNVQTAVHTTTNIYTNSTVISGTNGLVDINFSDAINLTKEVTLEAGDQVYLECFCISYFTAANGGNDANFFASRVINQFSTNTTNGDTFEVKLGDGLSFGGIVSTNNCLADIKQSDLFKDTCVRYCLVPIVDEDNKKVTLFEFSQIKNNIPFAVDWSDKLDQTDDHSIEFKIDSYGQRNFIEHKEDKFVDTIPNGSNGVILINNQNLEVEKNLYESPFAPSETVKRLNNRKVIYINLHDGVSLIDTASFKNGVTSRTCYQYKDNFTVTYTDGTTNTIVSSNIPMTWFIDNSKPYSAGFSSNQLDYSVDLISILQQLKIVKTDIRLNILDIINLNYFYPIYISEFNSYFFLSKINQFDYTSNESTKVELIKIN
jgi:hypothetical protein